MNFPSLSRVPMMTVTARSMPRFRAVGLAPAATVFTPSRKMAWARTVAVVVPSPAVSEVFEATSRTIWAPAFSSSSLSSISLATVTPSLVIVGEPNFFSMTTLRPFGPSVPFTASASLLTPRRIACRASSPYVILLAMVGSFRLHLWQTGVSSAIICWGLSYSTLLNNGENFVLAENGVLVVIELDLGSGVLPDQNLVAFLAVELDPLPIIRILSFADGDHFCFLGLFLGGIRNDDSPPYLLFDFDTFHENSI